MIGGLRNGVPPLTLVERMALPAQAGSRDKHSAGPTEPAVCEVDWSILVARAQNGDRAAYLRLLEAMTPYFRTLAARRHRDPNDVEDAVQDVLLTVHAIRHSYDPTRPFGPWLVAIANRRLIDRLRRQSRIKTRETTLTTEHETFSTPQANVEERVDRRELAEAIDNLPSIQRQAIRLLKLNEMSLKEAATASGMSVTSLKVATYRAMKSLRKMLSDRSGT